MQINKHGTFYIRNGWPTKIVDTVTNSPYIFSPAFECDAVDEMGVGRVMVKAMRYWAYATGITEEIKEAQGIQHRLTELGSFVADFDLYCQKVGTLWLMHRSLATNLENTTAWAWAFNLFGHKSFTKNRVNVINRIKKELENLPQNIARDIASQIQYSFGSAGVPLGQMFKAKYDSEWKSKRQKSFDYYTNAFLEYVSNVDIQASDYQIISSLSKIFSGLELEFWNDKHTIISELNTRIEKDKKELISSFSRNSFACID